MSVVYSGLPAREIARELELPVRPARLRLSAGRAGFRVYLADGETGAELFHVITCRTMYRAGLAVRGVLGRAGWDLVRDGAPGIIVREVEVNVPLSAASLEGGEL